MPQTTTATSPPSGATAIPPDAQPGEIRVVGADVIGPSGRFGKIKNNGMFNSGATTIGTFVANNPGLFPGISPTRLRVMRAVSTNEGKLEAINTYDNAFLSFGIFQWTAGPDSDPGELADFLDHLKTTRPAVFATHFGNHGLDVQIGPATNAALRTGFLVVNGVPMNSPAHKAALRQHIWAYRFWRAGHDDEVRACEIEQAVRRIDVFYPTPRQALQGKAIKDFITSEYGLALLLDEHVNRPGHVPGTLAGAISAFTGQTGRTDPAAWTTADEQAVLDRYLAARANTNMTNSTIRAQSIKTAVTAGQLSDQRGSVT